MSRIRSIKPDMWTSDDFLALSTEGQLAFVWLISNADDEGRLKTNPRHISRVLGVGDVTPQLVEMERRHMVKRYEVAGNHYIVLCNFGAHQRIDKPKPSSLPAPPNTKTSRTRRRTIQEPAPNDPGSIPDESRLTRAPIERTNEGSEGTTEGRANAGASDEADDGPIYRPELIHAEVVADVHRRGWPMPTTEQGALRRFLLKHPQVEAEDFAALWDGKPNLDNPWAYVYSRSNKDPENCTLVELESRRRREREEHGGMTADEALAARQKARRLEAATA